MTKKHFIALADSVKIAKNKTASPVAQTAIESLAKDMACIFKTINDRFDKRKFLTACGIQVD
jgi:L-2-hydroxyglutarate oxidase LhgO